jgi:hypothetical protein
LLPTLEDWLAVVQPYLTEPLFDARGVERLHSLARELPGDGLGALEVRLSPGVRPIDLSIRRLRASLPFPAPERISPPHLRSFLSRWPAPDGPFASLSALWLEFDLDPKSGEVPPAVPSVKLPADAEISWLTDVLLPALHGAPLSHEQRRAIHRCHAALAKLALPGFILYVFSLRARGSDAVRLELFGLGPEEIPRYLERVAPAAVPIVSGVVPLFVGVETVHLSFDIGGGGGGGEILPRIGVEGSFPRLPEREPRWLALLGRLVEGGLCTPEKRDALLAWPGYDTVWTAPGRWPTATAGVRGFCARSLSHVKVVCRPQAAPEAKAYLTFGWLPGGPSD